MVKILRIITRLNVGGPAIHTVLLSSSLNREGYRDILVCGSPDNTEGDMKYFADSHGVSPIFVKELQREMSLVNDIKAFFKIAGIIRREKPDIIHTHTAKAGAIGRCAAIFCGVKVKVHTFHGHIFDGYFSPVKARVFLWIERMLAVFTDKLIMVSDRVKYEIVTKLKVTGKSKAALIPLGLELDDFLSVQDPVNGFKKRFNLKESSIAVGIVGRLVPIKNHRLFIDSAKDIIDNNPGSDVKFFIVGDGQERGFLEKYVRGLSLEDRIIFTGWMRDLAYVYAGLDIVALTSLNEGTPVSLIEAMASSRPVISTDVGGVGDLIIDGQTGILVKSGKASDFSAALVRLIKDVSLRSMLGRNARAYVKDRYAKDRLINDIKKLYTECLNKKNKEKD